MTVSVSKSENASEAKAPSLTFRTILLGALAGMVLALFAGDYASRAVWDTWQSTFPREISTDNVAVVLIDDDSVDATSSWPWPRKLVAELIEKIGETEPAAIGVDIYFDQDDPIRPEAFVSQYDEEETDPALRDVIFNLPNWDEELARVIGSHPTVMARTALDQRITNKDGYSFSSEFDGFFEHEVDGTPPSGTLEGQHTLGSIYIFDGAAFSHGMVNGAPDPDGLIRRVPLTVKADGMQMPGFAAELARIATGTEKLVWDGETLIAGERSIPSDATGTMRFRMGEFPPAADHSAIDVLEGAVDPNALRGKIVVLGVGAQGTFDIVATPLTGEIYGAFVQAQAADAIIEGAWLSRPFSLTLLEGLAALVMLALILGAGLLRRNWLLAPAAAIALALPIASALAFSQANLLLDPFRPVIFALCAGFALFAARFLIARAERARLAAELVEERVKASKQQGELDAAFKIQMSMVPGEKVLSRLDERADIAGVLRPAKSVGGDFFDAVKINENQLLFLVGDVTGKGVPAALFMALSKTLSKSNLARAGDGLAEAVSSLNFDLMDEADEEMGLTMLIGLIDCESGKVELVNAGHENPMLVRPDGSVETLAMKGGPPFCVVPFDYPVEPYALQPGDTLVVITDGATEAANEADELFGMEGVIDALGEADSASAASRANHLADSVRLFEGTSDPTDDLTIFALRYLGND